MTMLRSIFFFASLMGAAAAMGAVVPQTIIDALRSDAAASGRARFMVTMPQMPDDVVYGLTFAAIQRADTLAPCQYLLEWEPMSEKGGRKGFAAYFDGNHFRYAGDKRIQEYHMEWDSVPFMPSASALGLNKGVQRTARFVDILPAFMAEALTQMQADPNTTLTIHADTLVSGRRATVIDASTTVRSIVARESEYVFDKATGLPMRITHQNSPGSISEQTVGVEYDFADSTPLPQLDEPTLIERYPDLFATYRQSNFRIENLRGKPMPSFTLPTTTGERYTYTQGQGFRTPTIVVLLETGQTFNPQLVGALREATDRLTYPADIVWAFADSHADSIEQLLGSPRQGEHMLMSGRGLVRDCGAAMLPSIILVGSDGTVGDVIIGFNNNMASDVIQKMLLIQ